MQAMFRTIPVNELVDGMAISPLSIAASEAAEDCSPGEFKIR
jgi:hypothetical protein